MDDSQLLERYDIDDSEVPQPRPSTSYDDFVGGGRPQPGAPHTVQHPPHAPYMDSSSRTYSQTSDLHNYSRYGEGADDFPDEDQSAQRYYDGGGPSDDYIPGGGVHVVGRDTRGIVAVS